MRVPAVARTFEAVPTFRDADTARRDRVVALLWGGLCHALFGMAVLAMVANMWFGMQLGLGSVPQPWGWVANVMLLIQFPLGHSLLLGPARRMLARMAPAGRGGTLATTTFALVASIQLLALFALWTPSGIVWWEAEGAVRWVIGAAYAGAFLMLVKASWDAGAEVQSGLLGWLSLWRGVKPVFPPMPVTGLFRHIRHPIYLAFALTTWAVPVWTPDQLLLAVVLTAYCAFGPHLKERRLEGLHGERWRQYRAKTPFWVPGLRGVLCGRAVGRPGSAPP
ncbi:MAG: isoprenylcysteine carboxylmethyltransferase family protein [Pseudomonadota bacterium]